MGKKQRALAGVALAASAMLMGAPASADISFASAVYFATHNSYSGGSRGTILDQLNNHVRSLEFDVHDNDYAENGFRIGHDSPGHEVDHSGDNPDTNGLFWWLAHVNAWSDRHRDHAPLVVTLDLKDNLTDENNSYGHGNPAALNDVVGSALGAKLVWANDKEPAALPSIEALRGRVIVVLSGDQQTRKLYRRDSGKDPGVAMNTVGQVVEVHASESTGKLWYWSGRYRSDGQVEWLRHGTVPEAGVRPSVALNDHGDVVLVFKLPTSNDLVYRAGALSGDGEIVWPEVGQYDKGSSPTIKFTSPTSRTLREIHRNQANTQNYSWNVDLRSEPFATWSGVAKTSDGFFPRDFAVSGTRKVAVTTEADGATPATTLRYATDRVVGERIRYQQVAFTEYQPGNAAELRQGALFFAAPATDKDFIREHRRAGKVVRAWDYDDPSHRSDPSANYPATNHPSATWYTQIMSDLKYVD